MATTDWLWISEDRGGFVQSLGRNIPVFAEEQYRPILLALARRYGETLTYDVLAQGARIDESLLPARINKLKEALIDVANEGRPTGFATNAVKTRRTEGMQREWYAAYRVNGTEVCRLVYKRDGNATLCLTVANLPLVKNECAPAKVEARRVRCQDQPQTKFFHGWETERQTLSAFFDDAANPEPDKVGVISALGGEGKTTLALQYWLENRSRYKHAFFLRADSEANLRNDIVALLRVVADETVSEPKRAAYRNALASYDADAQEFPQVLAQVQAWMVDSDGYLVVYDNADFCTDDARDAYRQLLTGNAQNLTAEQQALAAGVSGQMTQNEFRAFLPPHHGGHLLLTSRNTAFDGRLGIGKKVELRAYSWTKGAAFLAHRAKGDKNALEQLSEAERNAAEQIAEELGHLPLALEQAGAFINAHFGDLPGYLQLLQSNPMTKMLEQAQPQAGEYPSSVARTYDISIEAIRAKHPAALCALNLCAFLASDDLFSELFHYTGQSVQINDDGEPTETIDSNSCLLPLYEQFQDVADKITFKDKAFAEIEEPLTRYSLLEIRPADRVYRMHRLMQDVVRHRLASDERKEWIKGAAQGLLLVWISNEAYQARRQIALHVTALSVHLVEEAAYSETADALLAQTGNYLHIQGRYADADPILERSLQLCKVSLSYPHNDIATSLGNLAALYKTQGRYAEAEPLYNEALEIRRQVLPYPHNSIAIGLNNLAMLYETQGRYAEAEPLMSEALEIMQNTLGANHPNTQLVAKNLDYLRKLIAAKAYFPDY